MDIKLDLCQPLFFYIHCALGASPSSWALAGSASLDTYNYVIGTQTIGASYQFTQEPILIETARAILAMGSNTLKFSLTPQSEVTPRAGTLAEIAERDPTVRALFEMPFANYMMWVSPLSAPQGGAFAAKRLDAERREMYELVKYLLRNAVNGQRSAGAGQAGAACHAYGLELGLPLHPLLGDVQQ